MDIFLRQVKIIDHRSPFHNKSVDVLIKKGIISKIGRKLSKPNSITEWNQSNSHISIGWFDIGTQIGEPGFEQRESLESASRAAAAGGYTGLACFPNTNPCLHSKSEIQYIYNNTTDSAVEILPIGALSKFCDGEEITEMIDMKEAGAVAFSDGNKPVTKNGVLLRALEYARSFDGIIISSPIDKSIQSNGVINEGSTSVQLGMPGIPDIAEKLMVQRDLELAKYADGKILIHNISTQEAVTAIKAGQRSKLNVNGSICYLQLTKADQELNNFDPNLKVLPPLRTEQQRKALVRAIANGDINIITSGHEPLEPEKKEKEFFYADFGAIGLQTSFASILTTCKTDIPLDKIVYALSIGPRAALQLSIPEIKEKAPANLTIFNPTEKWTFDRSSNLSKSSNSPFFNQEFVGKVKAIIHRNQIIQ